MKAFAHSIVVASVLFAAGCQTAPPTAEKAAPPDPAPIDATRDRFAAAFSSGDAAATAAFYAEDAVYMAPNRAALEGRPAIQQYLQGMFAEMGVKLTLTGQEVQIAGDWAYDRGTYSVILTPKKGAPMTDNGNYLVILKRQSDGSWKMFRDIDNSSNPPPGTK